MRRIRLFILLFLLVLGATACGKENIVPDNLSLKIAESIFNTQDDAQSAIWITPQDDLFSDYLEKNYWLEASDWKDGAVCYADGVRADEIAVIQLGDDTDIDNVQAEMADYIQTRINAFNGYAPKEVNLLEQARVVVQGQYLALLICKDASAAQAAFEAAIEENLVSMPSTKVTCIPSSNLRDDLKARAQYDEHGFVVLDPPNKWGMSLYDTTPILNAWIYEDTAKLSDEESEIYEMCKLAIESSITVDMTDYQKELAIHDWIIHWANYDDSLFSHQAIVSSDVDMTPYGLLINRKAICMGYANTFQLFMDLLGIECLTVVGASYYNTQDHAWNMIKLDDEWYCVDTAWDDQAPNDPSIVPSSSILNIVTHRYFNLTSAEMRFNYHQWNYDEIPEATATKYKWSA